MQITLHIKCPTCLSDSIKKNGSKVDGKQNYQCKICKRQFIGDHALSYQGCHSGIKTKILHLMARGSGIRDIAEVERVSIGKVLRTLSQSKYQLQAQQSHYETLEIDEFWTFVGNKQNKQWVGKFFTVGIEGNNCRLRHRIRRGFRRSCNFSKKLENHFKAFDLVFFYINNRFI